MESKIAEALRLDTHPVALLWSDEKPSGAAEFKEGRWGCVMWLVASAVEGKTAACSARTFGCFGGGVGLGFGEQYRNFPGGVECFARFLSTGNEVSEEGRRAAEQVKPFLRPEAYEEFLQGERYLKTPELARNFAELLPTTEIPARYVVFKPLSAVDAEREEPRVVIFLPNPHQLAALTVLANYGRPRNENVILPFAAGCQALGIYPFREERSDQPRAVVGLVDLSARLQLKGRLPPDRMSFAVPYRMFREMEENVAGSFLERPTWRRLIGAE